MDLITAEEVSLVPDSRVNDFQGRQASPNQVESQKIVATLQNFDSERNSENTVAVGDPLTSIYDNMQKEKYRSGEYTLE